MTVNEFPEADLRMPRDSGSAGPRLYLNALVYRFRAGCESMEQANDRISFSRRLERLSADAIARHRVVDWLAVPPHDGLHLLICGQS